MYKEKTKIALKARAEISDLFMLMRGRRGEYKEVWDETALTYSGQLNSDQCKKARRVIDETLLNPDGASIWKDSDESDQRILAFEDVFPEIKNWLKVDSQINEVEKYIGRRIKSWFIMANKTTYAHENSGSGGGFHRDSPFANQLKLIWYLSDVNAANGPFQYVPKTNKSLKQDEKDFPLGKTRFDSAGNYTVETVTGQEGALLVCDTKCVHRGKPIEYGTRYAITLYTSPNPNAKSKHLSAV